jgi:hypothetical protein
VFREIEFTERGPHEVMSDFIIRFFLIEGDNDAITVFNSFVYHDVDEVGEVFYASVFHESSLVWVD